jgi:hypothetical protein
MPMWRAEDGAGILKGSMHADQHSAFDSAVAVNGFNLGLQGCNCAGTKRKWEWVAPEWRDRGADNSSNRTAARISLGLLTATING